MYLHGSILYNYIVCVILHKFTVNTSGIYITVLTLFKRMVEHLQIYIGTQVVPGLRKMLPGNNIISAHIILIIYEFFS